MNTLETLKKLESNPELPGETREALREVINLAEQDLIHLQRVCSVMPYGALIKRQVSTINSVEGAIKWLTELQEVLKTYASLSEAEHQELQQLRADREALRRLLGTTPDRRIG